MKKNQSNTRYIHNSFDERCLCLYSSLEIFVAKQKPRFESLFTLVFAPHNTQQHTEKENRSIEIKTVSIICDFPLVMIRFCFVHQNRFTRKANQSTFIFCVNQRNAHEQMDCAELVRTNWAAEKKQLLLKIEKNGKNKTAF